MARARLIHIIGTTPGVGAHLLLARATKSHRARSRHLVNRALPISVADLPLDASSWHAASADTSSRSLRTVVPAAGQASMQIARAGAEPFGERGRRAVAGEDHRPQQATHLIGQRQVQGRLELLDPLRHHLPKQRIGGRRPTRQLRGGKGNRQAIGIEAQPDIEGVTVGRSLPGRRERQVHFAVAAASGIGISGRLVWSEGSAIR